MTTLTFGYNQGLPDGVKAAWGARWIVTQDGNVDAVGNRQDSFGDNDALFTWLNNGAFARARVVARESLMDYKILTRKAEHVVLFEDETGVIVANTNGSHGYLYVAAYLKADVDQEVKT